MTMAGKAGRSGRPKGTVSRYDNPVNVAAHHLAVLTEIWLAGVPIPIGPGLYLRAPAERRFTVPPEIKLVLAKIAVKHVVRLDAESIRQGIIPGPPLKPPSVEQVMEAVRRRAPDVTLRRKEVKITLQR